MWYKSFEQGIGNRRKGRHAKVMSAIHTPTKDLSIPSFSFIMVPGFGVSGCFLSGWFLTLVHHCQGTKESWVSGQGQEDQSMSTFVGPSQTMEVQSLRMDQNIVTEERTGADTEVDEAVRS